MKGRLRNLKEDLVKKIEEALPSSVKSILTEWV
jgi:hypothetical protein